MIKVLGSSSKGNCYILEADLDKLIIECGIDYKSILKGLNYGIGGVDGCLVTHEHLDHSKSLSKMINNMPKVCGPRSLFEKSYLDSRKIAVMDHTSICNIGNFKITSFKCKHANSDLSECENLGYIIQHRAIGTILFATDTYYIRYKFKDIDHILIECNYSEQTIQAIEPHEQRVFKSHMSLETLKETLSTWDLSKTKTITLIHLSDDNGEPERFKKEIQEITGIPTYIATPGLEIETDLEEFYV